MRLSQMTTDEALDVLCELTPFIMNISADETLLSEIKAKIKPEKGATKAEIYLLAADKVSRIIPIILKGHREDIYGMVGVINGKTVDEIRAQNILTTSKQIYEMFKDKELLDFFKSCAGTDGGE